MKWQYLTLFLCVASFCQADQEVEISSVLNLQDENMLFFTSDGCVVWRNQDWCNDKACPNRTEASVQSNDNITEISQLWNNSKVIGIERVDASGSFRNSFTHLNFAILIQIDDDDLSYLVVNLDMQRIFGFGNGANLFGSAWSTNSCLTRIVDIVTDRFEPTVNYIVCREKPYANSSHSVYRAVVDTTNYRYSMLQPLNTSSLYKSENIKEEVSSPFYLGLVLPSYSKLKRDPITSIERWGNQLIIFHPDAAAFLLSNRITWSGPIEDIFSPSILELEEIEEEENTTPIPIGQSNDTASQMAQIAIILFTFAFLLALLNLLWRATIQLSDHLYEGIWFYSKEPVWLSRYDNRITI